MRTLIAAFGYRVLPRLRRDDCLSGPIASTAERDCWWQLAKPAAARGR